MGKVARFEDLDEFRVGLFAVVGGHFRWFAGDSGDRSVGVGVERLRRMARSERKVSKPALWSGKKRWLNFRRRVSCACENNGIERDWGARMKPGTAALRTRWV